MKTSILAVLLASLAACGSADADRLPESDDHVGQARQAFACSPAGSYSVKLVGTQQDVTGADYHCTGVRPYSENFAFRIEPHPTMPDKWQLRTATGIFSMTEVGGIVEYQSGAYPAASLDCVGKTAKVTVRIDETSIKVYRRCSLMSGSMPICLRYREGEGTLARTCAADAGADGGGPGDGAAPPEEDASASDGGPDDAAPTPDASTPDAATPDAATPDAATPDAATPDAATLEDASTTEADAAADPGDASSPPSPGGAGDDPPATPSCSTHPGSPPSSSLGVIAIALSTLVAARRRRTRIECTKRTQAS